MRAQRAGEAPTRLHWVSLANGDKLMIRHRCPHCEVLIESSGAMAGLETQCYRCRREIRVPQESLPHAGSPLVLRGKTARVAASADPSPWMAGTCSLCGRSDRPTRSACLRLSTQRTSHYGIIRRIIRRWVNVPIKCCDSCYRAGSLSHVYYTILFPILVLTIVPGGWCLGFSLAALVGLAAPQPVDAPGNSGGGCGLLVFFLPLVAFCLSFFSPRVVRALFTRRLQPDARENLRRAGLGDWHMSVVPTVPRGESSVDLL